MTEHYHIISNYFLKFIITTLCLNAYQYSLFLSSLCLEKSYILPQTHPLKSIPSQLMDVLFLIAG